MFAQVALTLKSWAPTWMEKFIAKQGLPKAVGWVKRESEVRHHPSLLFPYAFPFLLCALSAHSKRDFF